MFWHRYTRIVLCFSLAWCVTGAVVRAQPTPPGDGTTGGAVQTAPLPTATGVSEAQPSILYLPDDNGKLQPVVNFPLDEFQRLLELKHQGTGAAQKPSHTLRIDAEGEIDAERALLTLRLDVTTLDEQWTQIPLQLAGTILQEPPTYEGTGQHFLGTDPVGDGYQLWVQGPGPHQITLRVVTPVTRVGEERRLRIAFPRAEPAKLKLTIPERDVRVTVPTGGLLNSTTTVNENQTQLEILGLQRDFELNWRGADRPLPEAPVVLESVGTIIASIDGRTVSSEARLRVRSFGSTFDSFQVALPPGAELIAGGRTGYTVTPTETPPDGDVNRKYVEVRLDEPTLGPVEIRLDTERRHDTTQNEIELAGFSVVSAIRQSGFITLKVQGDWQAVWEDRRSVRQVDIPAEPVTEGNVVGRFEYLSQPFSLQIRIVPRQTRLGVEPQYSFTVTDTQVRLEATLRYTIRSAKAFALEVNMPGWQIDEIGPASVVDLNGVILEQTTPLAIPLLQASLGEVELRIRAHREVDPSTNRVEFTLPQPRNVNALGPASVIIQPADNVTLTPRPVEIEGLRPQSAGSPVPLSDRRQQREPLNYRAESPTARFVADFRVEPQMVGTTLRTRLAVDSEGGDVQQQLDFRIQHEPAESLLLSIPSALLDVGDLPLRLAGQALSTSAIRVIEQDDQQGRSIIRVTLPEPRIGELRIETNFRWKLDALPPETSVAWSVPLIMPVDAQLRGNELTVTSAEGINVRPRSGIWTPAAAGGSGAGMSSTDRLLVATEPVDHVQLALNADDRSSLGTLRVERAWIQTWLDHSVRQDRVVYRYRGTADRLPLRLPREVSLEQFSARIDGLEVEPRTDARGELWLDLPPSGDLLHVLEISYAFPKTARQSGGQRLEAPSLPGEVWVQQTYWQVVMPEGEYLLVSPAGFTEESIWTWLGYGWGRRPLMNQAQLELWAGATPSGELSPATNRYLFSTLGQAEDLRMRTVSRGQLILMGAGVALAIGLSLVHVPRLRDPIVLLVCAVIIIALGMLYPSTGLLLAQLAILGLTLTLLSLFLQRFLARRRPGYHPSRSSGSSIMDTGSTARQYSASLSAARRATTEARTVAAPASTSDVSS